jgi:hypothetical protein
MRITMNKMKTYSIIITAVAVLVVIVLIRTLSTSYFRTNASKWAAPSITNSALISKEDIAELNKKFVIVNISETNSNYDEFGEVLSIPARLILQKESRKKLRIYKKSTIILTSDDPALNARIWMLMSQLGYSNLRILNADSDNEVLKYEFRPDLLINKPELQSYNSDITQ